MANHNVKDSFNPSKTVSTWGIVVGLVSLHYGMGFILGTGEQTYLHGASGAVYAIASGLGLLGISALAGFYWRTQRPIWDLLGDQYGEPARHLVNFLSWIWMVGVMAGQMLGAGYALSVLGIPVNPAIVFIALAIAALGPIPLERIAGLFAILLGISSLALIFSLGQMGGFSVYLDTIQSFLPALVAASPTRILGTIVTTFLLTVIGMDFHQVLIAARSEKDAVRGSIFAGIVLIPIAFLPTAVVMGAINIGVPGMETINGKDAIPLILANIGGDFFPAAGLVLVLALVMVAIGSGTGLNRALIRSFQAAPFMPATIKRPSLAAWINAGISLCLAFSGLTIVGLMVSFYAIYVAGAFVPFMAYLLEHRSKARFTARAIQSSAWVGCLTAAFILAVGLIGRSTGSATLAWLAVTPEAWMTSIGIIASVVTLWISSKSMVIAKE